MPCNCNKGCGNNSSNTCGCNYNSGNTCGCGNNSGNTCGCGNNSGNTCGCGNNGGNTCGCVNGNQNVNYCPNPCNTHKNIQCLKRTCPQGVDCTPIYPSREEVLASHEYRLCTDQNGCFASYPVECRDSFWPSFAHPRWLCCEDLYCHC